MPYIKLDSQIFAKFCIRMTVYLQKGVGLLMPRGCYPAHMVLIILLMRSSRQYWPHGWLQVNCNRELARLSLDISCYLPNPGIFIFNTLRPRQNGRHFPDDIFKWIFLNENVWISINISLKFVPRCPINNIPTLVHVMAWRRPGDKPLSEPMMVRLPTHICVTRPQWVN